MPSKIINPTSVPSPAGPYSQAIESSGSGTWLHIAGQIGMDLAGNLPEGFEAQAQRAWSNLVEILAASGMGVTDLVKVTSYLVNPEDTQRLGPIRSKFLGEARPASTLVIVRALADPHWLYEVEALAFRSCGLERELS